MIFDQSFSKYNLKVQTSLIFTQISKIYEQKSLWSNGEKLTFISTNISRIINHERVLISGSRTSSDADDSGRDETLAMNNVYHRISYLIGYLKMSRNQNLKVISWKLALDSLNDIFERSSSPTTQSIGPEIFDNVKILILKKTLYKQFISNRFIFC